jgi:hypothetical protein
MFIAKHHPHTTSAPRGRWWAATPGNFNHVSLACPCCGHTITLRNRSGLRREDRITPAGVAVDVLCSWVACTTMIGTVRLEGWPSAQPGVAPLGRQELVPHPKAALLTASA